MLIIKIVATRCRILRLKCIKFRFQLGRFNFDLRGPILLREGNGAEGKRGGAEEKGAKGKEG